MIRNVRLHVGSGGGLIEDALFIADGERVLYAGPAAHVAAPAGSTVIDAAGRFLIPGLIDCHVHLCFDGSPDFEGFARGLTPAVAADLCRSNALRALEAGITTVRDLGGVGTSVLDAAEAQRRGAIDGARIVTAGEVLTVPGGHAYYIGHEVSSTDEILGAIRSLHNAGARIVKLMATGGVLTEGIGAQQSAFSPEQLAAAVTEARARGMRVAAHAIGAEGIEAAARAGVDSIEHGCFLSDEAIANMIATPTWLVPTLSAPDRISHGGSGVPEYARAKSAEVLVVHRGSFARAVAAGVRIAAGTDAGTPYNFHGGLAAELRLMHDAGLPLERALQSATREAAQLLGLGEIGTLEAGNIADCVLLEDDPVENVAAYSKVAAVVQSGRLVLDRR
ncbi:MAG: amidohydrolase family protein [Actinomycetota bacterium]